MSGERLAVRWLPLDANGDAAVKACEKLPSHPTLPRILQTGQVGTSAFVALDFPNGEVLSARGEERLENDQLLKLAAQLSDALATVHAQGVVHGEMSRDSVLMTDDGRAWLWDMPLVIANRLSDRRGENRLMQNLVKTAAFLSPERARGEGASQAGDVYALGAILCVSGGAPMPTASTTLGVVHQVATGEWTPRVPQTLPEQWRSMLEKMIAREASQRPSSADVALTFARVPSQNMLPTVPEMPAVRLPPEILQAADALMRSQVEALRAPTREVPVVVPAEATPPVEPEVEHKPEVALGAEPDAKTDVQPALQPALPLATDPMPELKLEPAKVVQPHTLDEVAEAAPRDVVRIPTMELKAIELEPGPTPLPAPEVVKSIALTDNLSVSADLAADAVTLSEEEVRQIRASSRNVWVLFGAVAAAVLALVVAVVVLAKKNDTVIVVPPAPVVSKPAPVVAPQAPAAALDELVPLPKLAAPAPAPTRLKLAPKSNAAVPAPVETAKSEEPQAEEVKPVEAAPSDFSFLEQAEAPKSELKRPSVDL